MIAIAVTENSQVAAARRLAVQMAEGAGFSATESGRVAIVVTELATNIIKHGGGGEILAGLYEDPQHSGIEIIAIDRGRGIADVQACLVDGYSSAGTAGHGLGAVFRQSHGVNLASWPNMGTALLARLERGHPPEKKSDVTPQWGAVSVAMPGEEACGDAWSVDQGEGALALLVADGLGHGPDAAEAAVEAVRVFQRHKGHQVPTLLDYVHGGLRATRGAAVAIARLDYRANKIIYAGIGNIAGTIIDGSATLRMVSLAGTAGHNVRKIQAFEYPFASGLVILHSDGLGTSWALDRYPGLARAHPTLIAAVLYRDFWRRRDDVTVLVAGGMNVQ